MTPCGYGSLSLTVSNEILPKLLSSVSISTPIYNTIIPVSQASCSIDPPGTKNIKKRTYKILNLNILEESTNQDGFRWMITLSLHEFSYIHALPRYLITPTKNPPKVQIHIHKTRWKVWTTDKKLNITMIFIILKFGGIGYPTNNPSPYHITSIYHTTYSYPTYHNLYLIP